MYSYIDTTSPVNPVTWTVLAPLSAELFESRNSDCKALVRQTAFATEDARPADLFSSETGPFAPTTIPKSQTTLLPEQITPSLTEPGTKAAIDHSPPPNKELDQIAKQRVRLMAAKYASDVQSSEIVARLEILNRRISERAPRVSEEQVAALEDPHEQLARIRAGREERAKRLGISI